MSHQTIPVYLKVHRDYAEENVGSFEQGLEGCSIARLLSFIFVNLKSTDKRYRSKRLTNPIEIINDKKLKEKQVDIQRTNPKDTNLIWLW